MPHDPNEGNDWDTSSRPVASESRATGSVDTAALLITVQTAGTPRPSNTCYDCRPGFQSAED